ncbi:hypothetical protein [Pelagicoccus albus]|uniref:Uncharacterized protein n=1 Tax=Pelagicoccus albus TaxID=415222 RepID=A0A7X1B9V7_9BACT|nr:hypothetical protein [Pelagicoccus albus]MBC2608019.1 hypothetical protein [Pelagicoccus albus]
MQTTKRLDEKLERIAQGQAKRSDFIIADAKDADMAFGIQAPGPKRPGNKNKPSHLLYQSNEEYLDQIRAIIEQDIVDILLLSASNLEKIGIDEGLFRDSAITPAARANDTTDVWAFRESSYPSQPSRNFRTASIDHIKYGRLSDDFTQPYQGADLGLYSITFTNDIDHDHAALETFRAFRIEAEQKRFRYFLEVFNPNVHPGFDPSHTGTFLNDAIVRSLAGVTRTGRPLFLKIPYNGPGPLEELVAYDPRLVVGILGGSAGTTLDAFQLIHDAQKYGAKVALFGRKINLSESPLVFINFLRKIVDGEISPIEAVKAYHGELSKARIKPHRELADDLKPTPTQNNYSGA